MSLVASPMHLPYVGKLLLPLFWPLSVWAVAVGGRVLLPPQAGGVLVVRKAAGRVFAIAWPTGS